MRVVVVVCLVVAVGLAGSPVAAQEAEALRRELGELKQQFQTMQEQDQKLSALPGARSALTEEGDSR